MSRGRKILIGVGVAAVVGVLAARAVMAGGEEAVTVRAEDVERRDLVAKVRASGHIEPKRSVDISADISGRIVQLPVEEGQNVSEGDLLLIIDPTQYEAAMRRAEASLAEARAREVQARTEYTQAQRDADYAPQTVRTASDVKKPSPPPPRLRHARSVRAPTAGDHSCRARLPPARRG